MSKGNKQTSIDKLAAKHLGQKGGDGYSDQYDPSLLVFIPRYLNREAYGIDDNFLPFVGYDVWNAYEVSALTNNGLPVAGVLKIAYPCNSPSHVESKSIKLYLNSFNMTKMGNTTADCIKEIERRVASDLFSGIGKPVSVIMYTTAHSPIASYSFEDFVTLEDDITDIDDFKFELFNSDKNILKVDKGKDGTYTYDVHTSLLRSNCRVTGQPDWGDVYIHLKGKKLPDSVSVLQYIISHRKVNHFHEEICEMIYVHLKEIYEPDELMVACLYTRRGGIDINPIRASQSNLIPWWFDDRHTVISKTMRQ